MFLISNSCISITFSSSNVGLVMCDAGSRYRGEEGVGGAPSPTRAGRDANHDHKNRDYRRHASRRVRSSRGACLSPDHGRCQARDGKVPLDLVGEIHLSGHFETTDGQGSPLCIDAHGSPVVEDVFGLFDSVIARAGPLPTLIEWDNDVPDWPVLRAEALAAQARLDRPGSFRAAPDAA
jgi:hypothetical protein